jgi:hypothetical protein
LNVEIKKDRAKNPGFSYRRYTYRKKPFLDRDLGNKGSFSVIKGKMALVLKMGPGTAEKMQGA